jgi:hypothetical protein
MIRPLSLLVIASITGLFVESTFADVTGSILGTVTDTTSAVIVGARITATNQDTNQITETVTNTLGQYRIIALPVGRYTVEAATPGFQTAVQTGIVLAVNDQREVSFTLRVGGTQQQVEVQANPVQVETASTQLGDVIDEKKITELPLNGRTFTDLFGLQAGVAATSYTNKGDGVVSVNGQRENNNGFLVNGGDTSDPSFFGNSISPNLDAIEEFRVVTNTFDAEYGRFSGAVMNAVTKSGTNQVHGSVYEFVRNNDFDARFFFNNAAENPLHHNQFGYAVGGPAIKNKLFWFTDLEVYKAADAASPGNLLTLPTAAQRNGIVDPSTLTGTVDGPYWAAQLSKLTGTHVSAGEQYASVFPNGNLSAAMNPVSKYMLANYIPEGDPNTGAYNVPATSSYSNSYNTGQRVDMPTQRYGTWSAYYTANDSNGLNPLGGSSFNVNNLLGSSSTGLSQLATLSNIYTVNPTAVNEARLSFKRNYYSSGPQKMISQSLSDMGFTGLVNAGTTGYRSIPDISTFEWNMGDPGGGYGGNTTYMVADNFSKIVGRHALKFGADARYYQANVRNGGGYLGNFNFDGSETGSDIADFLIGAANFEQNGPQALDTRARYGAAFAQDSFRVSSNLTINYGVRWEFATPWYDTQNKLVALVPGEQSTVYPTAPLSLVYPGDPGVPNTLGPTRYGNFAPRLGIAYSPNASGGLLGAILGGPGKSSIRIGSGIFYNAIDNETSLWNIGSVPFSEYYSAPTPSVFSNPYQDRATGIMYTDPFPFAPPVPGTAAAKTFDFSPTFPLGALTAYRTDNKTPYGISNNITLQRQLAKGTLFSVGYVGTLGRRLTTMVEANPANRQLCYSLSQSSEVAPGSPTCGVGREDNTITAANGTVYYGVRNLPGDLGLDSRYYNSNFYEANWASSDYNSAQAILQHKAGNANFTFDYTWSKSLDDGSAFNDRMNPYNHSLSRALSAFDQTHNFVASYTYQIPLERWLHLNDGWSRLVKGWEFSGITRFSTGIPINALGGIDYALTGTRSLDYTDFSGSVQYLNPRTAASNGTHYWMSTQGFSLPAFGSFGDAPKRFFHGPGIENWDVGLHKSTQIREHVTLQLRGEFFNAMNHAQFEAASYYFLQYASSFGRINSTAPPRIGQLALKLIF